MSSRRTGTMAVPTCANALTGWLRAGALAAGMLPTSTPFVLAAIALVLLTQPPIVSVSAPS